jgi:dihydrofolate synthase/folylpolyglutamate synthase
MAAWRPGAEEAIGYLDGLFRPGVRATPTLARMEELLRRLGHPEAELRTVHVTGTNGKGSVAATVAAIMRAAGHRTGLFVSPYLERFGERIVLDGRELPAGALVELVPAVRAAVSEMVAQGWEQPTEFEAITALGALYYAREKAEIVALEVGLGGALDATNAIPGSVVSVITRVGFDHMDRLGYTLAEIARAKCGIIRRGGLVVGGRLGPEALRVVEDEARERGAALYLMGRDFSVVCHDADERGIRASVRGLTANYPELAFPLAGRHQADNLACAVAAAECASLRGVRVDPEAVSRGVAEVIWPGRLEVLGRRPHVVLDGAHNPDAMQALAQAIQELFRPRRLILVVGVLGDKAAEAMLERLLPQASEVIVTTPAFAARAMPSARLADLIRGRFPGLGVHDVPLIADALRAGLGMVGPEDMLLVAGSLYLVGEARGRLRALLGTESGAGRAEVAAAGVLRGRDEDSPPGVPEMAGTAGVGQAGGRTGGRGLASFGT